MMRNVPDVIKAMINATNASVVQVPTAPYRPTAKRTAFLMVLDTAAAGIQPTHNALKIQTVSSAKTNVPTSAMQPLMENVTTIRIHVSHANQELTTHPACI